MEIEILLKHENTLLDRVEVTFRASHPNEATPQRDVLRAALSKQLNASKEVVVLDHTRSTFGRHESTGYAKVYKSKERALAVEARHILLRNGLIAEAKEEKPAEKKPEPVEKKPEPVKKAAEAPPKADETAKVEKATPGKKAKAAKPATASKPGKKEE